MPPRLVVFKEFHFEAAHHLPGVPAGHRCARLHGHSYRVEVHVQGGIDGTTGMVLDFADITEAFEPLRVRLDHRLLNDVEGLDNPTSEHLAVWIWEQLAPALPLARVVVKETATSGAIYDGPGTDGPD